MGKSLELDSSKIKFSPYKTGREQMVQSASLESLLQRLTTVRYSGMAFINTFLATYTLFTDAHTVMDFLVNSWQHCLKCQMIHTQSMYSFTAGMASSEQQLNQSLPHRFKSNGEKKTSVVGILFVLKHWASKHYSVSVILLFFLLTSSLHHVVHATSSPKVFSVKFVFLCATV